MARSRLHRRYRRRARSRDDGGYTRNPPLFTELAETIGVGFGGFAGTRLLTRVATITVAKHKPSWGKHAGAVASVGSFLAVWLLAHKWKWLARFQQPIAVGAGLAALQTLVQTYIPRLGWIVGDASAELDGSLEQGLIAPNLEYIDEDPDSYTYNDSGNQGRMGRRQHRADQRANGQSAPPVSHRDPDEDLLSDLDLDVDDAGGVAAQGGMAGGSLN